MPSQALLTTSDHVRVIDATERSGSIPKAGTEDIGVEELV